jgi:hypothetical protein
MPGDIINSAEPSDSLMDDWADQVTALLALHNKAVIAVDDIITGTINLRQKKALLVKKS